jgi:Family of unknown function (DUF6603)
VTDSPTPLDGAVVRFLLLIVDRFESTVSDPDALIASLKAVGLDDSAVSQYESFLSARASDISKLSTDLPRLLSVLESSNPDLPSLIPPVTDLWTVVTGLVADAPKAVPAQMPQAPSLPNGDVLGQLVTAAVDGALREESPAVWAALSALGFVGPGMSVLSSLTAATSDLLEYVWQLYQSLRRESTLSIAGLLTGPRVISMSSVGLGPNEPSSPEVLAVFGANVVVLQRLILNVAADTYGDPIKVKLEILGTDAIPPKFIAGVLSTGTIAAPVSLGPGLRLSLDPFNAPFALAMTDFGDVRQIAGSPPKLTLSAQTPRAFKVGSDGGIRLSLQQPALEATASPDSWDATFGVTTFELNIPKSAAGDLLGIFLPSSGVTLRGKLLFRVDGAGFHFDGGVGLSASWPDVVHLPGIVIHSFSTTVAASGSDFPITATGTIVASLGPLTVTIEGFGVEQPLRLTTDGSGNLGILDLRSPSFAAPTGIGVAIDASVVKGGGFLRVTDAQIAGALELSVVFGSLELSVQAFGVIQQINGQVSFIVLMSVTFSPPIEIFLGLTLNAVGGMFGLNRTVDTTSLGALIRDGHTKDVLIPDDLIGRADSVLAAVATVFPAKSSQYVAGPILELGWGRPISIVTMTVGVVFTFPNPDSVVIIGEVRIALPEPEAPIINLQADFDGIINPTTGDVSFDASLARSRIATFDVAGDLALRGGSRGFVLTAGGFNPLFSPPPDLTSVRRLSISISPSPLLKIWAESYFAVNANSVQFGAAMYMEAKLGPIGAKGHVSLDTLIRTEPKLHFTATISGEFLLVVAGEDLATMDVDVLLEGPGHWRARAHASISILFFSISGTLELEWGTDSILELGSPVDVAQMVHDALAGDATWTHVLPAVDAGTVQLRSGAEGLHPLGLLRLTQTAAPLDVPLEKFGANAVTSGDPVTVAITASGGVVTTAQEVFAPSQFFEMSDEDRIAKPAFLPFDAGSTIQGEAWQVLDPQTAAVVYEESLGLNEGAAAQKNFRVLDAVVLGWVGQGGGGGGESSTSARAHPAPTKPVAGKIALTTPSYSVADVVTGAIIATGAAAAMMASTRRSADTIAVADYEIRKVS